MSLLSLALSRLSASAVTVNGRSLAALSGCTGEFEVSLHTAAGLDLSCHAHKGAGACFGPDNTTDELALLGALLSLREDDPEPAMWLSTHQASAFGSSAVRWVTRTDTELLSAAGVSCPAGDPKPALVCRSQDASADFALCAPESSSGGSNGFSPAYGLIALVVGVAFFIAGVALIARKDKKPKLLSEENILSYTNDF